MKKVAIFVALLAVAAVGFTIWASFNLNDIVQSAIESNGSALTETEVKVDGVDIVIDEARATISGLTIGNPSGFKDGAALSFDSIRATLDREQIGMDLVVVEELEILNPVISYETGLRGSNLDALRNTANKNAGIGPSNAEAQKNTDLGPRFIIRKLKIGKGEITAAAVGQEGSSDFPSVVLRNVGGPDGVSGSQVGRIVISELTSKTLSAVTRGALDDILGDDAKGILDGLFGGGSE